MNGRTLTHNDNMLLTQLAQTHVPDGSTFQVEGVFQLAKNILSRTIEMAIDGIKLNEDKSLYDLVALTGSQSSKIERVACEIVSKNLDKAGAEETTLSAFKILKGYTSWEAKLVLILAAFAIKYGEFWLLIRSLSAGTKNGEVPVAKPVAILKHVSIVLNEETTKNLVAWSKGLESLVKEILKAIGLAVEFFKKGSNYQVPSMVEAKYYMSLAVYRIVECILACVTEITQLTAEGFESLTSEDGEWAQECINKIKEESWALDAQLNFCKKEIEEKMISEIYQKLVSLFSVTTGDIFKVLQSLISNENDALSYCSNGSWSQVAATALPPKTNVLLLISNLKIETKTIDDLKAIYDRIVVKPGGNLYKIVWIPIKEADGDENLLQDVRSKMPEGWWSATKLEYIHQGVINYIRDKWNFTNKPIITVLNDSGVLVNRDAFHMIRIFKEEAFPFDIRTEADLWRKQEWTADLLIHRNEDDHIKDWIEKERYILFCGGRDIKWLTYFVEEVKKAAEVLIEKAASDSSTVSEKEAVKLLHMVYMGMNSNQQEIQGIINTSQEFMHCPGGLVSTFWEKLDSMKLSMSQLQKNYNKKQQKKMQEIMRLISYDKGVGWVVLCKGAKVLVNGYGTTMLAMLEQFNLKGSGNADDFESCFSKNEYKKKNAIYGSCFRIDFPPDYKFPAEEDQLCPDCKEHNLKKAITFYCCHK